MIFKDRAINQNFTGKSQVMRINEVVSLLRNGATIKQNKDRKGYPITRIETIANRTVDRSRMGYAGITDLSKHED